MEQSTAKRSVDKGQQRRWFKRAVWFSISVLITLGVVVAALPKPMAVEGAVVDKGELTVTVDEDGVTRVKDRYVVSAPLSGNLARIELHAGDTLKQGAVLASILPLSAPLLDARSRDQAEAQVARGEAQLKQAKAQIERAEAALDYAGKDLARTRELVRQGTAPQAELDRALLDQRARRAELASAEFADKVAGHELRMARAALGRLWSKKADAREQFDVPSPISGQVLKVIHESEGVVQAGAPLLELGDPAALEIVVDVLTNDAVHIAPHGLVTVDEWGGKALAGSVRLVEPSAFTRVSALGVEEQRVNAIVDLSAPYKEWTALGDGYRVRARIRVYHQPAAVRVPVGALFRKGSRWALFSIESGVARLRVVDISRRNDQFAEVTGGVSPGTTVVLHPSDQLDDGTEVEVR